MTDEEIEDLVSELENNGFSESEIDSIVELVKSQGSLESATDLLKAIGEKEEINWNEV